MEKKKTNVLLLGDSIRMNYEEQVAVQLGEGYYVWGSPDNGRFAKYTLCEMKRILEGFGEKPDVIHWNNGLWDTSFTREDGEFTPLEEYVRDLSRLVRELKELTNKIIFATTTPVRDGNPNHYNNTIMEYNSRAVALMQAEGVMVNDLFSMLQKHREQYICDDFVHLTEDGKVKCAEEVCKCIRRLLANEQR
ncbi:MAG: SGNH/GDSL hydrolase family protein [Lachnospiraceae bacterium]|nr:SGNH/GDSL hydrolase family protein [Lachnospiraceae bacterium]